MLHSLRGQDSFKYHLTFTLWWGRSRHLTNNTRFESSSFHKNATTTKPLATRLSFIVFAQSWLTSGNRTSIWGIICFKKMLRIQDFKIWWWTASWKIRQDDPNETRRCIGLWKDTSTNERARLCVPNNRSNHRRTLLIPYQKKIRRIWMCKGKSEHQKTSTSRLPLLLQNLGGNDSHCSNARWNRLRPGRRNAHIYLVERRKVEIGLYWDCWKEKAGITLSITKDKKYKLK